MSGGSASGAYRQLHARSSLRCTECCYEVDGRLKSIDAAIRRHMKLTGHRMILDERYRYEIKAPTSAGAVPDAD